MKCSIMSVCTDYYFTTLQKYVVYVYDTIRYVYDTLKQIIIHNCNINLRFWDIWGQNTRFHLDTGYPAHAAPPVISCLIEFFHVTIVLISSLIWISTVSSKSSYTYVSNSETHSIPACSFHIFYLGSSEGSCSHCWTMLGCIAFLSSQTCCNSKLEKRINLAFVNILFWQLHWGLRSPGGLRCEWATPHQQCDSI